MIADKTDIKKCTNCQKEYVSVGTFYKDKEVSKQHYISLGVTYGVMEKALCFSCYDKQRSVMETENINEQCILPKCIKKQRAYGYCDLHRKKYIRNHPGLTFEKEMKMFENQSGKCYLCQEKFDSDDASNASWVIEHDHNCDKHEPEVSCDECRRGLACDSCNIIIAFAKESPAKLRAIADTLEKLIPIS